MEKPPINNKAPAFLQGLRFVWCRHQESNPGSTDCKEGALNNKNNELGHFLLRGGTLKPAYFGGADLLVTW
jgi:hypothetical protein